MTNKIQISTVHKEADVQVIELNAQFIARVVESEFLTRNVMGAMSSTKHHVDENEHLEAALDCWVDDLEKVWSLLSNVKQAFLCEERVPLVSVHLPTTSPSI